ncbi:MAG: radical SAM protein, partial [Promethearchaeota archaeon]
YCCVKNARGRLKCYDPAKIVENVEFQLNLGIKEIYLTSQDCSIYKYRNTDLKDLIVRISRLEHDFFLRIGMINPRFLIDHFEQLLTIFKLDKVYQFLHLPIQSGSDKILKKMQRPYLISDILDKIDLLRKQFPFLTFSTDIICGFPSESEHDFYRTINVIKWLKPDIINISKFTTRPHTEAKNMEQLDSKIIKERSKRLSAIFRTYLTHLNDKWMDWKGKMLCLYHDEKNHYTFGRNFAYKNILLPNIKIQPGKFIQVSIQEVDRSNLIGKPY